MYICLNKNTITMYMCMFFLDAHHSQQKSTSRSRCNLVPKSPPPGVVGA